ncbi:LysR substrate-binding domain-containing protein [Marinospirillum sp.]|uniref:LysR substrate-binding domain-containing protein n=1 Tax=Marinospirillum sp. TaxID=2183934 RepID=UPI003A853C98
MSSPLTLDALRTLDAIVRRGSFAAAAQELHRVPSAVSYTIQKLEQDLDVQIFDRSRRQAQLTHVGQLLLDQGRQIIRAADELTLLAREAATGWEAELRICIDTLLDPHSLYPLIGRLQQRQPHTEIRLSEEVLAGSWDALHARRCDLVIGADGPAPHAQIQTHHLGSVEFVFAVSPKHPLTRCSLPLTAADLRQFARVVVGDTTRHLPARSTGLLDGQSQILVPSLAHKIELQRQGLGVGYLPRHRIREELAREDLVILPIDETRPVVPIYLAWQGEARGQGLSWMIEQVKQAEWDPEYGLLLIETPA